MTDLRQIGALLNGLELHTRGDSATPIAGLAYDSREVEPGFAFVAIPGFVVDGFDFVPQALERGAVAVLAERPAGELAGDRPAFWGQTASARRLLAAISCRWFGHPSRRLRVVGVTGTNGKTTVTALTERLLGTFGATGRWSTTCVQIAGEHFPTPRTTPEALELQGALARMLAAGCASAVIEVSSHALSLHRVDGTRFQGAVFTNLSPDHLDFHHTMDAYLDAKANLFEHLEETAPAVVNLSDHSGSALAARSRGRVVGYGWSSDDVGHLDYGITDMATADGTSRLELTTPRGSVTLATPLFGRANAENIAAAVAIAMELGVAVDRLRPIVAAFTGEPGRFEAVDAGQAFGLLVDFAHTPGALRAAIEAVRGTVRPPGRLIVVFGCGGDRDQSKRPQMGAIAAAGADVAIVTSDNPRSESPAAILDDILAGIPAPARGRVRIEQDRREAIRLALEAAGDGDCVLIAGKGHETEQIFADRVIPFDDRVVAREILGALVTPGSGQ